MNTEEIIKLLSSLTEAIQVSQQVMKSHQIALQALLECHPDRKALVERYEEILRQNEEAGGAPLPRVLH